MLPTNLHLLAAALQRESSAVLTCGEGLGRREIMVEFSSSSAGSDSPGFWAAFPPDDAEFIDQLIESGKGIQIWFQNDASMMLLNSTILKKRRRPLGKNLLLVAWPNELTVVEQRQQRRCPAPQNAPISAHIQLLTPGREIAFETTGRLWDVGLEGASVICTADPALLSLPKDSWLKITITRDKQEPFFLSAAFRNMLSLADNSVRIGLQFLPSGDPSAASATAALHALVKELQPSPGGNASNVPPSAAA